MYQRTPEISGIRKDRYSMLLDTKFWMVINVADWEWKEPLAGKISKRQAPTFLHFDRDRAVQELFRLKSKYPDIEFHLLESVGTARAIWGTGNAICPSEFVFQEFEY
jgi:hypothetical protein